MAEDGGFVGPEVLVPLVLSATRTGEKDVPCLGVIGEGVFLAEVASPFVEDGQVVPRALAELLEELVAGEVIEEGDDFAVDGQSHAFAAPGLGVGCGRFLCLSEGSGL